MAVGYTAYGNTCIAVAPNSGLNSQKSAILIPKLVDSTSPVKSRAQCVVLYIFYQPRHVDAYIWNSAVYSRARCRETNSVPWQCSGPRPTAVVGGRDAADHACSLLRTVLSWVWHAHARPCLHTTPSASKQPFVGTSHENRRRPCELHMRAVVCLRFQGGSRPWRVFPVIYRVAAASAAYGWCMPFSHLR